MWGTWVAVAALALLQLAGCMDTPPACETKHPKAGGLFSSDHFPLNYGTHLNCSFRLEATTGKRVELTFFVIELEQNDQCRYDWIRVLDSDGSELHKLCGDNQDNFMVTSSDSSLSLELRSDSVQDGSGFLASWREVEEVVEVARPEEGRYMLTHPATMLVSSPERLCVELFQPGASAELTAELFSATKEPVSEPWLFTKAPVITETGTIDGVGCLNVTVPAGTLGDSALLRLKLAIGGSAPITTYRTVRLLQREDYPLVQTDKGQYKAGDTVKFRLLLLDHTLRPSPIAMVDELWVEDVKGRRVQQWKDSALQQGILQRDFNVGEEPELGAWTINYKAGGVKGKDTFLVSEYVLPKFSLEIKAPPAVLKNAEDPEWLVCAKYTHGGAVKGVVRANFSSKYVAGWREPPVWKSITLQKDVGADEECASVKLSRSQLLDLTVKVDRFNLDAEFEEDGTGTIKKESVSTTTKDKEILLETGSSSRSFIVGGFPYTGELVVKNHDGSPVAGEEMEVCVRLYRDIQEIRNNFQRRGIWSMDEEEIVEMGKRMQDVHYASKCHNIQSDASGKIKFHVPLGSVPEVVKKLSVKAKAVNRAANTTTKMVQPEVKLDVSLSHDSKALSLGLVRKEKKELPCNQDFVATVFFSSPTPRRATLHYNAVSKGVVFKNDRMEVEVGGGQDAMAKLVEGTMELGVGEVDGEAGLPPRVSSADITLPMGHAVSPSFKLVVFVNEGNTTLGDSHTYSVEACQEHQVTAQWSQAKVYPGADVTLSITAQTGSLCALSATDKSVELLGNKNKVTEARVNDLKEQIGRRKTGGRHDNWKLQRRCPKAYEALKVFEGTGIHILTDLPIIARCETLTDAHTPQSSSDRHEVLNSPPGLSRSKRLARQRRCTSFGAPEAAFGAPAPEAALADEAPQQEAFGLRVSSMESGVTQDSLAPKLEVAKPKLDLRSFFPETWLFSLELIEENGRIERALTAPHTITTWNGEAVCVSSEVGLGVAKPAALLVSQDFFAELRLPYSVKRGENFLLNVTVFNYVDVALPMEVTVKNRAEELKVSESVHSVCLGPRDNQVISIPTEAMQLGELNVTVEAVIKNGIAGCEPVEQGDGFKDALVRQLKVKPEGVPVEVVESDFKCFESGSEKFEMSRLEVPANVVEDSARAWVYLTGDIMAPALENVGNLVRQPTGCGEQNMVGLVPNIYLLQYLENTGQREEELEAKAKDFMRIGYRRQANYNHPDGSYSIWGGDHNKDGSSWLTAFVVKSFSEAARYIEVDTEVVQRSVDWLMKGQMENGCFPKRGYVHSSYLKGGGSDASLTPFIVTALLEAASSELKIKVNSDRLGEAVDCMWKGLNTSDTYTSIVTAHTMSLLKSKKRAGLISTVPHAAGRQEATNALLADLLAAANTTGGQFWAPSRQAPPCPWRWGCRAPSEAVEQTAYMVQSLVLRDREAEALPSVKWLGKQRNSQGGFVSTQDTVVALQALSLYSQRVTRIPLNMAVSVKEVGLGELGTFALGSNNGLLLQSQKLTRLPVELEVDTKGSGCAMVQTVLRYNTPEAPANAGFSLSAVQEGSTLSMCAEYTGGQEQTGMVLIEVEMVSGWEAVYPESLVNEIEYEVQRVERGKEDKETVVLYFDAWPRRQKCVPVELKQVTKITEAKPALVTIYDYYNTDDKATLLYSLK